MPLLRQPCVLRMAWSSSDGRVTSKGNGAKKGRKRGEGEEATNQAMEGEGRGSERTWAAQKVEAHYMHGSCPKKALARPPSVRTCGSGRLNWNVRNCSIHGGGQRSPAEYVFFDSFPPHFILFLKIPLSLSFCCLHSTAAPDVSIASRVHFAVKLYDIRAHMDRMTSAGWEPSQIPANFQFSL